MDELKKARQMVEEPGSNCLHYLRKSHGIPCACELVNRCQHLKPIQEEDVVIFWRKLEIGYDIPEKHRRDMESEMRDLTSLLQEISTGPISNVREVRQLIKGVIHPVLSNDLFTKGRRKMNSTKRDKSHWEYISIAHRKIGKSSGSSSGSGSGSGSRSNPSPRGRGRPPRSGSRRGRGRSSDEAVTGRPSTRPVLSVTGPRSASPLRPLVPESFRSPRAKNSDTFAGNGRKCFKNFLLHFRTSPTKVSEYFRSPAMKELRHFRRLNMASNMQNDPLKIICLFLYICMPNFIVDCVYFLNYLWKISTKGSVLESVLEDVLDDPQCNLGCCLRNATKDFICSTKSSSVATFIWRSISFLLIVGFNIFIFFYEQQPRRIRRNAQFPLMIKKTIIYKILIIRHK
ncbi:hypothetical protein M9H77_31702 [Catharanthus roseus]|uniref:Uncharacterized protein n=1 Tax=Catharanthus roseus TaxID=4058 RepID=A0ACC0A2N9_CATRO|nr:hypothetical protein M9H77_31702 [Catharanthus roseus]